VTWAKSSLGLCDSDSLGPGSAGLWPARRIDWLKGVLFGNVCRRDAGVPEAQRIDRAKTMAASHRMFNPVLLGAGLACDFKGNRSRIAVGIRNRAFERSIPDSDSDPDSDPDPENSAF
jgi:hypothetical protein